MAEQKKEEGIKGDVEVDDVGMLVTNDKSLAAITAAEVDIQISTAHRFPRSLALSRQRVLDMACVNEEVAASCFYSLPREGKNITGPSVRFAEIVASSWGNLRVQARVTEIGDTMIVAQGVCHDLETNVALSAEARVRITNRSGKRYNDDMIGVACASALSKATRNAIFKVVPRANFIDIEAKARQVAGGDSKSLSQNRTAMLAYLKSEYKVDVKRLCSSLGVSGVDEITTVMIADIRGRITAIKEGDATVDTCFPFPTREVGTVDIEATLGKGTEQPMPAGGSAETAPQPKAEAEDEAPALEPAAESSAPPATAPVERSMADQIRDAWGAKLKEVKGVDPDPDLVDEQIDAFCANWAKMSFVDVEAKHPTWLPKLLGFLTENKIPAAQFDFNVNPAPEA